MEIIGGSTVLLSNQEVLDLLAKYGHPQQTNLATILYETTSYLESGPTTSHANLAEFLNLLNSKSYVLSKLEKIQIVNLQPSNRTELHLILDDLEGRFNGEQVNDLLEMIQTVLRKPVQQPLPQQQQSQSVDDESVRKRVKQ